MVSNGSKSASHGCKTMYLYKFESYIGLDKFIFINLNLSKLVLHDDDVSGDLN